MKAVPSHFSWFGPQLLFSGSRMTAVFCGGTQNSVLSRELPTDFVCGHVLLLVL
jgi:hypothetical protein